MLGEHNLGQNFSRQNYSGQDYDTYRKMQIVTTVEKLLEHMTFKQLTVKMVCDEANISRPTFYHHFKDKFEVAQWFWDLAGEKYLRQCGRTLNWYESNLGMLRTFRDHAVFFASVTMGDEDHNACRNHGYRKRESYLEETIRDLSPALLTDDLRFQIKFFVDAESRAISEWLQGGLPSTPERLARRIELCVPRELYNLVEMACRQAQ